MAFRHLEQALGQALESILDVVKYTINHSMSGDRQTCLFYF